MIGQRKAVAMAMAVRNKRSTRRVTALSYRLRQHI
jgi:hypothetical protein